MSVAHRAKGQWRRKRARARQPARGNGERPSRVRARRHTPAPAFAGSAKFALGCASATVFEAFAAQAKSYRALLRQGMAEHRVASKAMLRQVGDQLRELMDGLDGARSPLDKLLVALPSHLHARAATAKASFRAAIEALLLFFEDEYIPIARAQEGCAGLPCGEQVYALCLRYHTTTAMTPDEIHELGLAEVARIQERYQTDVLDKLGVSTSFDEFVAKYRAPESDQYFTNKKEWEKIE